jgi:ankyrin repeat protein
LFVMPDANSEPDVDWGMWKVDMNLTYSMIIGIFIILVFSGLLTYFVGKYWQKVDDLRRLVFYQYIEPVLINIPFVRKCFGAESKQKLLFVPDADNKPEDKHEISELVIFRFLLNEERMKKFNEAGAEITEMLELLEDIDKESKITECETHENSMYSATDWKEAFHGFIVFKTTSETDGDYWWSLEKDTEYIILQRSSNKENVKDKLEGKQRKKVKPIREDLKGKGTIKDLLALLWAHQLIAEKYHIWKSNCHSLVTFVGEQITEIGYKYKGFFPYSPPRERGWEKEMLDLINILTGPNSSQWHPLFYFILSGNTDLVDNFIKKGKFDIDLLYDDRTPLHLAIMLSKTKMVEHLLNPPLNADPTKRDGSGKDALQYAATTTMKKKIFDVLLAHPKVKVDDANKDGETALHFAASLSNVTAVQKLLDKGANPSVVDNEGKSPLNRAAHERDGCPIIDLLLKAQKVKGMGDVNDQNKEGRTALHCAAMESNEITAEHLIEKGADVNHQDNDGETPLHVAAMFARDMKIIDVLLSKMKEGDIEQYKNDIRLFLFAKYNEHGLGNTILDRLVEKNIIKPRSTETSIDLRFDAGQFFKAKVEKLIDEILKDENFDINSRNQNGHTVLFSAIVANSVNGVRRVLERGADPTIQDEDGDTPIHLAVMYDTDLEILNLLLESGKVDINETTPEHGHTALHKAIMKSKVVLSHVATALFLLSKEAINPNVADIDGVTPLHMAAKYVKDMNLIDILLNHPDVDVNLMDNEGKNALDYARENKEGNGERIVNRLKEKGAVETEEKLPKGNKEFLKKHARVYSNRKPYEDENFLNFLSDDTISNAEKFYRIKEELLAKAMRDGKVETVRLLLEKGENISERGENGESALHKVSFSVNTTDAIDFMLDTGELDINGVDNNGWTPLHYAIRGTNCDINARHLIRKGADPTIANKEGDTPLHYAASHAKEIETINLILENEKVNINHRDKVGMTALHHAIMTENVEMVRYLLKRKADHTIRGSNGITPFHLASAVLTDTDVLGLMLENKNVDINGAPHALHLAIMQSNVTTTRFLLSNGADPNVADEDGVTPLHVAAKYAKDMDIVRLLLDHPDVDVNYLDNMGKNALRYGMHYSMDNKQGVGKAIFNLLKETTVLRKAEGSNHEPENIAALVNSHMKTIRLLIEDGQDISEMTWGENGANALHLAAADEETTDLINAFLETGEFDIDGVDNDGWTPLHYAIMGSNSITNVPHLIQLGADPKVANNTKVTPLHLAAKNEETAELIDTLVKTGQCNINGVDSDGRTPLYYAIKRPDPVTINVHRLIKMGADPGIADRNRVTLLHLAAIYANSMDLIELLLNTKKLDVTDCDDNGLTAHDYARYNKHGLGDTIVDRLAKHLSTFRIKVLVCICFFFYCVFQLAFYIVEA